MNKDATAGLIAALGEKVVRPVLHLSFMWDGVHWTDESDRVLSITINKRLFDPTSPNFVMGNGYATMQVTLDNQDFRFSPGHTTSPSPIASFLDDDYGHLVKLSLGCYVSGSPELISFFVGKTYSMRHDGNRVVFTVYDKAIDYIQNRIRSNVYEDIPIHEAIDELGKLGNIAFLPANVDKAPFNIPVLWLDNDTIWSDIQDVAALVNGFVFFDDFGDAHFWTIDHLLKQGTPVHAFDEYSLTSLSVMAQTRNFVHKVIIEIEGRYKSGYEEVYSLDEQKDILPGETVSFEIKLNRPTIQISPLSHGDNFWLMNPGGFVMNDYVDVSMETYAQAVVVTLKNNHSSLMARLEWLQLYGVSFLGGYQETLTKVVTPSKPNYRARTVGNNVYLQEPSVGKFLLNMLAERYKKRVNYWATGPVPMLPHLQLGDYVKARDDLHREDYIEGYLVGIDTNIFADSDTVSFHQSFTAVQAEDIFPVSDYFFIGSSELCKGNSWH